MRIPNHVAIVGCTLDDLRPATVRLFSAIWREDIGGNMADTAYDRYFHLTADGGEPAGLLLYRTDGAMVDFSVLVVPRYRRQGYATLLIKALVEAYLKKTVRCDVVNEALVNPLRRLGFTAGYHGTDFSRPPTKKPRATHPRPS